MENMEDASEDRGERQSVHNVITLSKGPLKRSIQAGQIEEQIRALLARINTPGRVQRGWSFGWDGSHTISGEGRAKVYTVSLIADCNPDRPRPGIDAEFANIVSVLVGASNTFPHWKVTLVNGEEPRGVTAKGSESKEADFIGYAPFQIPSNWREWFDHIYERDAQIELMMSKLEAATISDWNKRFNAILTGPPACGKTEMASTIYRMSGQHGGVWRVDGTAITQAGFLKMMDEAEELPRVLIWEEIEKTTEDVLRPLLGLLDTRGEIRKTTARKAIVRDARLVCIATVNDYEKFQSMLSGALASRFGMPIYCPRPDRKLLAKILKREVDEVNGDERWIEPTLDYMEEIKSSDPRLAIDICLSGRAGWLDGSYATKLRSVRKIGSENTNA